MKFAEDIILRPIWNETAYEGFEAKRYTFEVAKNATKPEIAKAVEELFKVDVLSVNTINVKKKPRRVGVHAGYVSGWKKAIVTLKPDSKPIEFFEGIN